VDTIPSVVAAFRHVLRDTGPHKTDTELRALCGVPLRRAYDLLAAEASGPDSDAPRPSVDQCVAAHEAFDDAHRRALVTLFDGALETLALLRDRGVRTAVVTSRTRPSAQAIAEDLGLLPLLDALVTPEMTAHHKPHPEPALKALELCGGLPATTLFIGDLGNDILCGAAAGMDTCLVTHPPHAPPPDVHPTYHVSNLRDLSALVL
jgi:pyrophosphatase PpaX